LSLRTPHKRDVQITSLADQVYSYLRLAIISSELAPGEKLVELDIAKRMSTSQGPVREALQRLERDGLVERKARSASYVTSIPMDEMYELFAVRASIEAFAIRHTAQHITPEQCSQLDSLIYDMQKAAVANDIIRLAEFDMGLHRTIVELSGRSSLLRVWNPLSTQCERFIVQSHPIHYPDYVEIATRHTVIVDALRAHDAEAAVRAVQEHIMLIWPKINP